MVDTVKLLGALLGGGNMSSGSGASVLQSVLGAALSGGTGNSQGGGQSGGQGGLGDLLGSVLQGSGGGSSSQGGLGGMLGSILGSALGGRGSKASPADSANSSGGLGDLLGGILGGQPQGPSGTEGADLSDLVGAALSQFGNAEKAAQTGKEPISFDTHSPDLDIVKVQDQAEIMVRAMINAAKSDGRVDKEEQKKILGKLGSLTQDEVDFVNTEISHPLDIEDFARSVPRGMENQVYAMSLMAIDLDSNAEAQYLHKLGKSMGMKPETMNQVHRQLGVQALYT